MWSLHSGTYIESLIIAHFHFSLDVWLINWGVFQTSGCLGQNYEGWLCSCQVWKQNQVFQSHELHLLRGVQLWSTVSTASLKAIKWTNIDTELWHISIHVMQRIISYELKSCCLLHLNLLLSSPFQRQHEWKPTLLRNGKERNRLQMQERRYVHFCMCTFTGLSKIKSVNLHFGFGFWIYSWSDDTTNQKTFNILLIPYQSIPHIHCFTGFGLTAKQLDSCLHQTSM